MARRLAGATVALVVLLPVLALSAAGAEHNEVYNVPRTYTDEGQTTTRQVTLLGESILEAWFNITVTDAEIDSDPDAFTFTARNTDDPGTVLSLPGQTGEGGVGKVSHQFTREASVNWEIVVSCTDAGDRMVGPIPVQEDERMEWTVQVDYVYFVDEGGNGNGGNGGGGGDDGDRHPLQGAVELNLVLVGVLSLLVAILALNALRGEGRLLLPFSIGLILLVDTFFAIPLTLLVNEHEHGVLLALGAPGPGWSGTLVLLLLVVWLFPLVLAKKRLLTSETSTGLASKLLGEGAAGRMRGLGRRFEDDKLSARSLAMVMTALGIASLVLAGAALALL